MAASSIETRESVWAVSDFRRVLSANIANMIGSAVAPVALAFAVLATGGGATSLSIVLALNTVPSLIALLYGGVLADRTSRSTLLLIGRCGAGSCQAVVATLVLAGVASAWSLGALGFASGIATALSRPASQGIFKQIVSTGQLQEANAINRLTSNLLRVAGPVAAGFAVSVTSPGWVLAVDAITFFVSAGLLATVKLSAPIRVRATNPWQDLREGWHEARLRSWFLAFTFFGAVVVVLWRVGYELLGPVIAKNDYNGASTWGAVQGGLAAGMVVGGFISLRWKPYRIGVLAVAGGAALGVPLICLGLHAPTVVVVAGAVFAGIGLDLAIVAWSTVMGQHIDDSLQGRLQSINSIGELSAVPLGYVVVGVLSSHLVPTSVVIVAGIAIVVVTAINLAVRSIWSMNRLPG